MLSVQGKKAVFSRNSPNSKYAPGTSYGSPQYEDFSAMGEKVSIHCWNVNGLNSTLNKGKFQDYLAKAKPDIVCLNETKTDPKKIQGVLAC